ncbi:MAG TPA: F0F1 ATP synthase subunit alpha, partial [Bacteroidota bacterium]
LFYQGVRPAINVGISVSRVGGTAQIKALRKVAGRLRIELAQYRELEAFSKFGSDLDKATLAQLRRGAVLVELLKQDQYQPMPVEQQVAIIFAGTNGFLDDVPLDQVRRFEKEFLELMQLQHADLLRTIAETKDLSDQTTARLKETLGSFKETFMASVRAAATAA